MRKNQILIQAITAFLILLFAYSAFGKLLDMSVFRGNMYNQRIPRWLAGILFWSIPLVEAALMICLLFPRTLRLGLVVASILLFVYLVYSAAIVLHFFKKAPCPCGGIFRHMSWEQHFLFNLACLLLTLLALILYHRMRDHGRHSFFHK